MDEGVIYEEGTPEKIFEHPAATKPAFLQRIRSCRFRLDSADLDLYRLMAEVEAFCDRHVISRRRRHDLLLLLEELVEIYRPDLKTWPVELAVTYSEKTSVIEVACETDAASPDPFTAPAGPEDFGRRIIENLGSPSQPRIEDGNRRIVFPLRNPEASSTE